MKALLLAGVAALFLATPAQATFFPGPSGSCCNQFGGGGVYAPPISARQSNCVRNAMIRTRWALPSVRTAAVRACAGYR
jgi:hypothetical protein